MRGLEERARRLRDFFGLGHGVELFAAGGSEEVRLEPEQAEGLDHFNMEWHIIPSAEAVPLDQSYLDRLYGLAPRDFARPHEGSQSYRERFTEGHKQYQSRVVCVETTLKPRYLPGNRQFYGTIYGHDASADPFAAYMGRAGMMNGMRYDHNYLSLREFVRVLNEDWRARRLLPAGYRATVCPPVVFNLVGTVFHPEWSQTESLEMGFYRDRQGNATCYAVGSNGPGDFSYVNQVEGEDEWSMMGFRVALVPES